ASGYNVTLVTLVLFGMLTTVGVRRQKAFPLLLAGIFLYVFLAGSDPPVVRAGIMGALVLSGRFIGRSTQPTNMLLVTVSLMLLLEPRMLRDDVGFQLSVASTAGLLYFTSAFSAHFKFIPEAFGIREAA